MSLEACKPLNENCAAEFATTCHFRLRRKEFLSWLESAVEEVESRDSDEFA